MKQWFGDWPAERERRRKERELEEFVQEVWGPWPPSTIDKWDHSKLTAMIVSGELPRDGRAYAESRLRIVEQELGPAGRAALWAKWAFFVSILSAAVALAALVRS